MKWIVIILLITVFPKQSYSETFFISNEGNDLNTGLSPAESWKTIQQIKAGNTYLLHRGEIFHFAVTRINNESIKDKIIISAYGKGDRPIISMYKTLRDVRWQNVKQNIWKLNLKDSLNFTGYDNVNDTNVGFIKVNKQIKGNKLKDVGLLNKQWDFFSDNQFLYIYSIGDPSSLTKSFQLTTNTCIIRLSSNMTLSNLKLIGSGGHAIHGADVKNVHIKNVEIAEIGGSYLIGYKNNDTRYGNGIEFGHSAINCVIEKCYVSEVYDAAYTLQGSGRGANFTDVIFLNNVAIQNEQSFEFWIKDGELGFQNCKFISNKCYNAGYGWSHSVRPDQNVGVHILNYYWQVPNTDLVIKNNIFDRARSGYIFMLPIADTIKLFRSLNNNIGLDINTPIRSTHFDLDKSNIRSFYQKTGLEEGSKFRILN